MIDISLEDDEAARRTIRESLGESLLVEAAAGTGKTYELVQRLVNVLRAGAKIEEVVAVTFTRKAAGELKLRLRQELDRARQSTEDLRVRANLERSVAKLEDARIGTIHSFCAELLRERPVEAQIDPQFRELSDHEGPRLHRRAFRRWLEERLGAMPVGLRRALLRPSSGWDGKTNVDRLEEAALKLADWRDFDGAWREDHFDVAAGIDQLVERVKALAARSEGGDKRDELFKGTEPARSFAVWLERAEQDQPRDHPLLEGRLLELERGLKRNQRTGRGTYAPEVSRAELLAERDALLQELATFRRRADAHLACLLERELSAVVQAYQAEKRALGALDFQDLLLEARDLVRGHERVRAALQRGISHIFVDEFQDTDPLQTEILLLLASSDPAESSWRRVAPVPGKLFLVGDPKQSIYRFRRADVALYHEVRRLLADRGVTVVKLGRSFRATRPLQEAVNAAFAPVMVDDEATGQPGYVPLLGGPAPDGGAPPLVALPVPYPHGRWGVQGDAVERSLPEAVGAFVAWLLEESRYTVRDPFGGPERVPVRPRHIALLFRRYSSGEKDLTAPYVRALEARDTPHVLVDARSFHQREEVEALRAALTALEWPTDELAVFATLRGPLFAFPDHALLAWEERFGPLAPHRAGDAPLEGELEPVRQALRLLGDLSRERNLRPIVDTVSSLLEACRAHAGFALRAAGAQVLANVQQVLDLARSFELGGGISFRGFVERVNEEAERSRSREAPVFEEGVEGVRLMTVHAAKGLEFPVVILVDVTAQLAFATPDRHLDPERNVAAMRLMGCAPWELTEHEDEERLRDEAEGVRLAYVAATRARDMLVVPVFGEGAKALHKESRRGWLSPLDGVVYPAREAQRKPVAFPGVPVVGEESVLGAPEERLGGITGTVRPGFHLGAGGGPGILWWDPAALDLSPRVAYGLRQEQFLAKDGAEAAARAGIERYQAWRRSRAEALELGLVQTVVPLRASEALVGPRGDFLIAEVILPRTGSRPSGARFGTLVHQILRDVPFEAARPEVEGLAKMHGRILGATAAEVDAAVAPVLALLGHELIARARAASPCHREHPIVLETDDGSLLDGVIDLAFAEAGAWVVVDFKTDFDPRARHEENVRQLEWYLHAMERITEAPVRGLLVHL